MMALKNYLKGPIRYKAESMNEFVKVAKARDAKSINVIIDHSILDTRMSKSSTEENDTHIKYEALLPYSRKVEFQKYNKDMSQLEAIVYARNKADWLEKKFPDIPVIITNTKGEDITRAYEIILKFANKTLSSGKTS